MKIIVKKNTEIVNYILVFLLLYVSNDTLLFGTNNNKVFFLAQIGIISTLFVVFLFRTKYIKKELFIYTVILIFMILLTQIVNKDGEIIKYIYNIFIIGLSFLVVSNIHIDDFIHIYKELICVFAFFSILCFCLWYSFDSIIRIFPTITNESDDRFFFLVLGVLQDKSNISLQRMYGIFREPGVYMCYLVLALVIELFYEEKKSITKAMILVGTSLLTFSTAAYFLIITILVVYIFYNIFNKNIERKKAIYFVFMVLVLGTVVVNIIGYEKIWETVFKKLYVTNASLDARLGSFAANIRIANENPFFGKGWNYVEDNFSKFSLIGFFKGLHNTNTVLKILSIYGVGFFLIIILGIISFFNIKNIKKIYGIICSLIWIVALCNEDLITNVLLYIVILYGLQNLTIQKHKTKLQNRM